MTPAPRSRVPARLTVLGAALLLAACGTAPSRPGHYAESGYRPGHPSYRVGPPYEVKGVWYSPKVDYDYDRTGTASWYGPQFDHRLTANGEVFDMNRLSAAHKTLPLPSIVEVTNLENGRSLDLRVNDRGPFVGDRLIDVSRRAAQLLGFEGQGTTQVRVRILKDPSIEVAEAAMRGQTGPVMLAAAPQARVAPPGPAAIRVLAVPPEPEPPAVATPPARLAAAAPPPPVETPAPRPAAAPPRRSMASRIEAALIPRAEAAPLERAAPRSEASFDRLIAHLAADRPGPRIFVQAGAFSLKGNAERVQSRIARLGAVRVTTASVNGTEIYRVRLGPLSSVEEANHLLARVIDSGYAGARIVND